MPRLMLGVNETPILLVEVADSYNPLRFSFSVVNGCWDGYYNKGEITVKKSTSDVVSKDRLEIICKNQDRLSGDYSSVFENFSNKDYIAEKSTFSTEDLEEDTIPF